MIPRKPKACTREGCDREAFGKLCNGHQAQLKQRHARAVRDAGRPKSQPRPKLPPVSDDVRVALYARQDEHCPWCGNWMPLRGAHVHHRKKRSQGGTNDMANLLLLHPLCHKAAHESTAAYAMGFLVRRDTDPAEVSVVQWVPPPGHRFVSSDGLFCDRCNLPLANLRHRVADAA